MNIDKDYKMTTTALLRAMFKASSLDEYLEENADEMNTTPFSKYITDLCEKAKKTRGSIFEKGDIDRDFGYKLFKGTRNPSRDTVIRLAFGFEADISLTQELLKQANMFMLHPRIQRDATILRCIYEKKTILQTQTELDKKKLMLIGGS